ncbi:serine hydrolase domain-containing protein [Limosilactobacillus albertensis]|uniref:Beta-lactamase family protein n=1 Tax=Limosilactobacillus albertensis TaxID=2759752 RepID=A0A839H5Z3_9LACO|nr:serine hydrolase domain-containing protein [Limosilactobacillus albertensis]MBB1124140.1 beta-lactamase family protein [Limosilactobacillus albertensis]MCD7122070.1 beta-lactamase family protein [Limosilactobacillus albertensis]
MKKFNLFALLMLTSLALFLASAQPKIKADPIDQQTQSQLQDYLKSHHINGVMLVNGKGSKAVTITNRETTNKREIVTANQLFPIASLQKIMTGTAIYQLKQQKQLTWDTSLHRYFPQVDGSDDITIRELMNHTSGLVNNDRPQFPLKEEKQQIAYMLKHLRNNHVHTWDYQDVDYEMLAAIISKQTHLSYNAYIHKTFTKPLHLHQIKDFSEVKQKEVPQPMDFAVDWHRVTITTSSDFGAGNLFMSPNNYWKFVYNDVLSNPKMIPAFYQQAKNQEVAYFGGVYFDGDIIRANGSIPGYNCCFVANYKTKRMIMLFSNNIDYLTLKSASDDILHNYMDE